MPDALRLISSAPPARPADAARPSGAAPKGEFADLLARAASGELISGTPVKIDRAAGLELADDQLARLSLAADRAEAEGLSTALVLIDGLSLVMDVKSRTIERRIDLTTAPGITLTGIDGVLTVPGADPAAEPLPPPGPALPTNPSLLDVLSRPPHRTAS